MVKIQNLMERGIKLSIINAKLKQTIDLTFLLGKLQQSGFVKIVFDPSIDEEPLVQLTEKGRQEMMELLFPSEQNQNNRE
jgi:DNA-binding MarR family transcriptional regulator